MSKNDWYNKYRIDQLFEYIVQFAKKAFYRILQSKPQDLKGIYDGRSFC